MLRRRSKALSWFLSLIMALTIFSVPTSIFAVGPDGPQAGDYQILYSIDGDSFELLDGREIELFEVLSDEFPVYCNIIVKKYNGTSWEETNDASSFDIVDAWGDVIPGLTVDEANQRIKIESSVGDVGSATLEAYGTNTENPLVMATFTVIGAPPTDGEYQITYCSYEDFFEPLDESELDVSGVATDDFPLSYSFKVEKYNGTNWDESNDASSFAIVDAEGGDIPGLTVNEVDKTINIERSVEYRGDVRLVVYGDDTESPIAEANFYFIPPPKDGDYRIVYSSDGGDFEPLDESALDVSGVAADDFPLSYNFKVEKYNGTNWNESNDASSFAIWNTDTEAESEVIPGLTVNGEHKTINIESSIEDADAVLAAYGTDAENPLVVANFVVEVSMMNDEYRIVYSSNGNNFESLNESELDVSGVAAGDFPISYNFKVEINIGTGWEEIANANSFAIVDAEGVNIPGLTVNGADKTINIEGSVGDVGSATLQAYDADIDTLLATATFSVKGPEAASEGEYRIVYRSDGENFEPLEEETIDLSEEDPYGFYKQYEIAIQQYSSESGWEDISDVDYTYEISDENGYTISGLCYESNSIAINQDISEDVDAFIKAYDLDSTEVAVASFSVTGPGPYNGKVKIEYKEKDVDDAEYAAIENAMLYAGVEYEIRALEYDENQEDWTDLEYSKLETSDRDYAVVNGTVLKCLGAAENIGICARYRDGDCTENLYFNISYKEGSYALINNDSEDGQEIIYNTAHVRDSYNGIILGQYSMNPDTNELEWTEYPEDYILTADFDPNNIGELTYNDSKKKYHFECNDTGTVEITARDNENDIITTINLVIKEHKSKDGDVELFYENNFGEQTVLNRNSTLYVNQSYDITPMVFQQDNYLEWSDLLSNVEDFEIAIVEASSGGPATCEFNEQKWTLRCELPGTFKLKATWNDAGDEYEYTTEKLTVIGDDMDTTIFFPEELNPDYIFNGDGIVYRGDTEVPLKLNVDSIYDTDSQEIMDGYSVKIKIGDWESEDVWEAFGNSEECITMNSVEETGETPVIPCNLDLSAIFNNDDAQWGFYVRAEVYKDNRFLLSREDLYVNVYKKNDIVYTVMPREFNPDADINKAQEIDFTILKHSKYDKDGTEYKGDDVKFYVDAMSKENDSDDSEYNITYTDKDGRKDLLAEYDRWDEEIEEYNFIKAPISVTRLNKDEQWIRVGARIGNDECCTSLSFNQRHNCSVCDNNNCNVGDFVIHEAKVANCSDGNEKYFECNECGTYYVESDPEEFVETTINTAEGAIDCHSISANDLFILGDGNHAFTYEANNNEIIETCSNEGCDHEATASIALKGAEDSFAFTGEAIEPDCKVTYSKNWEGPKDLVVTYSNNTNASTRDNPAKASISYGEGEDKVTANTTFTINPIELSKKDVDVAPIADVEYTGETIPVPSPTIIYDEHELISDTDYTVDYHEDVTDKKNVGTKKLKITFKGNYSGSINTSFDIVRKNISEDDIVIGSISDQSYNGSKIKPELTVEYQESGKDPVSLTEGEDYVVTYSSNKDATENAKATVKLIGNYKGTKEALFTILPETLTAGNVTLSQTSFNYEAGVEKKPDVTVKDAQGNVLKENDDYMLAYEENCIDVDLYEVTVSGIGNYTGVVEANYNIIGNKVPKPQGDFYVYNGTLRVGVTGGDGYVLSGEKEATNVGIYKATATLNEGYAWTDDSRDVVDVRWGISKATLTVSYPGETIQYGAKPSLSPNIEGFVNGETRAELQIMPKFANVPTNVGSHELTPGGAWAENYKFNYEKGTLTIDKANQYISVWSTSKTYKKNKVRKKAQRFTIGKSAKTPVTFYKTSGSSRISVSSSGVVTVAKKTGKGKYYVGVRATTGGNTNYNPYTRNFTVYVRVK